MNIRKSLLTNRTTVLHYGGMIFSKEKDHAGVDRHALVVAAFRLQRPVLDLIGDLLRQPHLPRRWYGYGEPGPLHHPGVLLPRADAVPGSRGDGRLYIQRRRDNQELPGPGMAGRDVLPHPEPGRANGEILRYYSNSRGENAGRKVWMTPSPASSNRRETKRRSGKVGPDWFRRYTK